MMQQLCRQVLRQLHCAAQNVGSVTAEGKYQTSEQSILYGVSLSLWSCSPSQDLS